MTSWFSYKNHFWVACLALLLSGGCTDETPCYRGTGGATGKVVTVSLQVSLPPAQQQATKEAADSITALPKSDLRAPFRISLEQAPPVPATKAADAPTPLYNLWLFQFNQDGSINGTPHKLTDGATPVDDRVTLKVPLMVATDQTLYLLVMGPKLSYDFSTVSTLTELKDMSFDYLTDEGGLTKSLITGDDEIPFAGSVSGVTVSDIDGGQLGLVEYNKPDGFAGGIQIQRLMARITLRYKFDVGSYTLQGMKLLNANRKIRLNNPDLNAATDSYATLEYISSPAADATDGYATCTWYVAQNRWGTVGDIRTESERYYKVVNAKPVGKAPELGTQIEAWAYSTTNPDVYAIYQMYVGSNNTDNFDVEANHYYNLRTTINTDINSAKNDQRIRTYDAQQRTEFYASALITGTPDNYNKGGAEYDLDAHFDSRQVVVQTQGQMVNVGIYTDPGCTTPVADGPDNWLQLSFSPNYTEAYNNRTEPLTTSLSATAILPTRLIFYLYNNEYIHDTDGNLPDTGTDNKGGKRSLYLGITTSSTGDGGTARISNVYRIDQRPAIYCGRFGGPKAADGRSYTKGLVYDQINECNTNYTSVKKNTNLGAGYYGLDITTYGADDMNYGKEVTRKLAENPNDLIDAVRFPNPPLKEAGRVLLYQYTYYDTFAARYCYDRNRDENGNGKIDDEEFKWYLPAANQILGVGIALDIVVAQWSTTAYSKTGLNMVMSGNGGMGNEARGSTLNTRCVRDIEISH